MKKTIKTKDKIQGELIYCQIKQPNTEEPSCLFCTKIELVNNHLMFYNGRKLVFKVWLEKEDFNDINDALNAVNINIRN